MSLSFFPTLKTLVPTIVGAIPKVVGALKNVISGTPQIQTTDTFLPSLQSFGAKLAIATGASATLVPPKTTGQKEVKLGVPNLIQQGSECGPTVLAMAMKFMGVDPGNYHQMFSSDSFGHGPLALADVAAKKGFTVRQENNGSLDDLAALVDKGISPMVLGIYGGGDTSTVGGYINSTSKAHWMTVTGYRKDEQGNITHIYFNDPNKGTTQCWTAADFKAKFWDNNIIPGGHCTYMAIAKKGTAQEVALKQLLPQDKISPGFALAEKGIDLAEKAGYATEAFISKTLGLPQQIVDAIAETATSAWNKLTGLFA
ncbi:MAG: C39 family peptidase [Candidatus Saganbacteria bacterium]|nr:C39 family peptidase [Candidatus Saganbacteria bacterium]